MVESHLRHTLIERAGFPAARFVLRDWTRERDTAAFKRQRLGALAAASPRPVILVGDDTERDPELFLEVAAAQAPGRVAAIYIRRNLHRDLPEGVIPFVTAFDVAVHEVAAGRLSAEAAVRVGEATLTGAGDQGRRLYPPFYRCPTPAPVVNVRSAALAAMGARIRQLTETVCQARGLTASCWPAHETTQRIGQAQGPLSSTVSRRSNRSTSRRTAARDVGAGLVARPDVNS